MHRQTLNRSGAAVLLLALAACGGQPPPPPAAAVQAPAPGPQAYAEFDNSLTIRDVMNTLIDPHADSLWNAVRYEADADGARDIRPQTDEEWAMHRKQAITIIEGANALMIPGRRVAAPGATTEFPAYEYLPDEVAAKLGADWQSWLGFAKALQVPAFSMLQAIEARDADLLSEHGAALDEACEGCHSVYWYRAEVR